MPGPRVSTGRKQALGRLHSCTMEKRIATANKAKMIRLFLTYP